MSPADAIRGLEFLLWEIVEDDSSGCSRDVQERLVACKGLLFDDIGCCWVGKAALDGGKKEVIA